MRNSIGRTGVVATLLVAGCVLSSPLQAAEKAVKSPEVTHTGTAPTGYTVTFRYANPAAKNVQVRGEWFFERPSELPQRVN